MGEIKSTMDLVMEKTRNMTLSEEEKEAQKKEEMSKSLRGLVVKFKDGILPMERLVEELKRLETSHRISTEPLLEKEILEQVDLDGENAAVRSLLKSVCKVDPRPLETMLNEYKDAISGVRDRNASELKDRIQRKWKISGSAVVPNIEDRPAYVEEIQSVKDAFRRRLPQEFENMRRAYT